MQEAAPPGVAERYRRSSAIGTPGKQAYGVRMGAGANSYVVRDKQIEVLKNVHGGVRVRQIAIFMHDAVWARGFWQLSCLVYAVQADQGTQTCPGRCQGVAEVHLCHRLQYGALSYWQPSCLM